MIPPRIPSICLRALSKCFLNIWQAWCHDPFPGEPILVPTALWVENLFLTSNLNLSSHCFLPFPWVLLLVTAEKNEISACPWVSSCEKIVDCSEVFPQSLLSQAKQNKSPQQLLTRLLLQTLIIFRALFWTLCNSFTFFLHCGAQNCP